MGAPCRLIVQSDWDQVLRDNEGKAWVTWCRQGQQKIHSEIHTEGLSTSGQPYVTASDNFNVECITKKTLTLSYTDVMSCYRCNFQAPNITFNTVHRPKKSVICVDATSGDLAVSSDTEGKLRVWQTDTGEVRRDLTGHLGDVYTCRFFPSGLVVLSGGADMQLKIWSVENGQCAATLRGHTQGITDTAIVEKGRNIISCSRDGTAKLWDCGHSACLGTVSDLGGVVNGCALGEPDNRIELGVPVEQPSEREVLTEGKMLLLAVENGTLQGFGLHSRSKIFEYKCTDAVNCCNFLSTTTVVCGTQDSTLNLLDLRNTSTPIKCWKEQRGAVLSLLPHKQGFFCSTGDGSCFYVDEQLSTNLELTGSDCDPIYKIALDSTNLLTACRDGSVRKYKLG